MSSRCGWLFVEFVQALVDLLHFLILSFLKFTVYFLYTLTRTYIFQDDSEFKFILSVFGAHALNDKYKRATILKKNSFNH